MAPRRDPTASKLLEVCWRFIGPSKKPIACGIYGTTVGLEVRVGYTEDDLLYSRLAIDWETARETTSELRQAMVAQGFTEMSLQQRG